MLSPRVDEVRGVLRGLVGRRPDVLVIFNSGHGNRNGVLLADGILGYSELTEWIQLIGATHTLVLLDVCHAGAMIKQGLGGVTVGALDLGYIDALAVATPSTRVFCSVGIDRNAAENAELGNGYFTASVLEAASILNARRNGWINDAELFTAVERISKRWGQRPEARGITRNFPVIAEQRDLIGDAVVIGTNPQFNAIAASALIYGRSGIPTRWRAQLMARQGQRVLADFEQRFMPTSDEFETVGVFPVPHGAVMLDPLSQMHLLAIRRAPLAWHVAIEDLRGRVFEEFNQSFWWAPMGRVSIQ